MRLKNGTNKQENGMCHGKETNNNKLLSKVEALVVTFDGCKIKLKLNSLILARWYDSLFHPAVLVKYKCEEDQICQVRFDDQTECWLKLSSIQWQQTISEKDVMCSLCHCKHSIPPNEIVLCDGCGLGFHQICHHPLVPKDVVNSDTNWFCILCSNKNSMAGALRAKGSRSKKKLSYNIKDLHWLDDHSSNKEQCYCYCGGAGAWFLKMVQCKRCKQWFHEACLSVRLSRPQGCGDTHYLFVCALCNEGHEILRRIDLRWVDIAHLAVFNKSIHKTKYVDFDEEIMPWINARWKHLNIGKLAGTVMGQRFMLVLRALRENTERFKNGREVKKSQALYALRVKSPLCPPDVSCLPSHFLTPTNLTEWLSHANRIIYLPASSIEIVVSTGNPKRKRKCAFDDESDSQPVAKKQKISPPDTPKQLSPKVNGTSISPTPPVEIHTRKSKPKHRCNFLDRNIPTPGSFTGINHPFLYPIESNKISTKRETDAKKLTALVRSLPEIDDLFFAKGEIPVVNGHRQKHSHRLNGSACTTVPERNSGSQVHGVYQAGALELEGVRFHALYRDTKGEQHVYVD